MKQQRVLTRTTWLLAAVIVFVVSSLTMRARAQEHHAGAAAPTAHAAQEETEAGPVLPVDPKWSGIVVIVILAMFVLAATIGPIVRSEMPDEVPVPHGHDEVVGHEDHGAHEPHHGLGLGGHGHGHSHGHGH